MIASPFPSGLADQWRKSESLKHQRDQDHAEREKDDHIALLEWRSVGEHLRQGELGLDAPVTAPLVAGEPFAHVTDLEGSGHPLARGAFATGVRVLLSVALRKGDDLIGLIIYDQKLT